MTEPGTSPSGATPPGPIYKEVTGCVRRDASTTRSTNDASPYEDPAIERLPVAGILARMRVLAWISSLALAACGGGPDPILRNVPQPNKAAVAGAAAAIAGAATLASPHDAAKRQEQNKVPDEKKPMKVDQTVPSDVLDRLDAKQKTPAPGDKDPQLVPAGP